MNRQNGDVARYHDGLETVTLRPGIVGHYGYHNEMRRPTIFSLALVLGYALAVSACDHSPEPKSQHPAPKSVQPQSVRPVDHPANQKDLYPGMNIVDPPPIAELRARLSGGAAVWVDKGRLNFAFRAATADAVSILGGIQKPMKRVADTDLWALSLQADQLERLVLNYEFNPTPALAKPVFSGQYRGPDAGPAIQVPDKPKSKLEEYTISSQSLGEDRRISVYRLPGASASGASAIFMADGQAVEAYARLLEPLVADGRVRPLVLVGVHSNETQGDEGLPLADYRGQEYVPTEAFAGADTALADGHAARFAAHMQFVVGEVMPWATKTLHLSPHREDRIICGFSNGAVFAATLGVRHAELVGHVIALSMGLTPEEPAWNPELAPTVYASAGTLEAAFFRVTKGFVEEAAAHNANAVFSGRVGGHDSAIWRAEFVAGVLHAIGN